MSPRPVPRRRSRFALLLTLVALGLPGVAPARVAHWWLTSADGTRRLERQQDLRWVRAGAAPGGEVELRLGLPLPGPGVIGFGAAMTDASASVIGALPPARRHWLMRELFGPATGLSLLRLGIGATDFSTSAYSYDDQPPGGADPGLRGFSLGPARTTLIPLLREARRIRPDLRLFAATWSAPGWMKSTDSMIGGTLRADRYGAFAAYLRAYVRAMAAEGVPVNAITLQNEPGFEPGDYPGMRLSAAQRAELAAHHVGPALRGTGAALWEWDHNWDKPEEPLAVLADPAARERIAGLAWHCYAGDPAAQDAVRQRWPHLPMLVTECSGGEWMAGWGKALAWQARTLLIGSLAHGGSGVILWNLALDPAHGPHHGGCGDCRGLVTIAADGTVTRNVDYYVLAHAARFVQRGARRIGLTGAADELAAVAFRNADGARIVLVFNGAASARAVRIGDGRGAARLALPAGALATLRLPPG
ncbi:MAG: glycosyl hydrolase [Proteobacteria bacterium]|nr:glycosyl hydrolase [Pseudomonadota bacterium]